MRQSDQQGHPNIDPVQYQYAGILRWVVVIGLGFMFAMFVLYATGVVSSATEVSDVPNLWHLSSREYADHAGSGTGWSWIESLSSGENLALLALVFFPAATIVVLLVTVTLYRRRGDNWYALIALVEVLVLTLAATGLLAAGH